MNKIFIVKIYNEYVLDDENGELRPELGMKKYAKKFNTEKEAYSYAKRYFGVSKNEIEIIKVNSMKDTGLKDFFVKEYTPALDSIARQLNDISRNIKNSANNDELVTVLDEAEHILRYEICISFPWVADYLKNLLNQIHRKGY